MLENLERQLSGPQPTVAGAYDMHRLDENVIRQWATDEKHRFMSSSEVLNQDEFRPQWVGKTRWELAGIGDANSDPIWRAHKSILDAHESFSGFVYKWSQEPGKTDTFVIDGSPVIRRGKFRGYRGFARIVDIEATAA